MGREYKRSEADRNLGIQSRHRGRSPEARTAGHSVPPRSSVLCVPLSPCKRRGDCLDALVRGIAIRPPVVRVYSNQTGEPYPEQPRVLSRCSAATCALRSGLPTDSGHVPGRHARVYRSWPSWRPYRSDRATVGTDPPLAVCLARTARSSCCRCNRQSQPSLQQASRFSLTGCSMGGHRPRRNPPDRPGPSGR